MMNNEAKPVQWEIEEIISEINTAWIKGSPEKLEDYFHEDMVIVGPDFSVIGKGRTACVNSYREFIAQASEIDFTRNSVDVSVWGGTSIASYSYTISWKSGGKHFHAAGKDMFIFSYIDNSWKAVWRMAVPGNTGASE